MRFLFFLFSLTSLPFSRSHAQIDTKDSFTISGRIIGRDTGVVVLWYRDNNYFQRQKKISLEKGSFTWSGTVKSACEALLWTDTANKDFDDSSVIRFLLEPGITSIVYRTSNSTYTISGSAAENENEKWKRSNRNWLDITAYLQSSMNQLYREQRVNKIDLSDTIKVLSKRHDSIRTIIRGLDLDYIKSHPNSFLSVYLLDKHKRRLHLDTSIALYSLLSNEVKTSVLGFDVLSYVYPLTNDSSFRKENPMGDRAFTERLLKIQSAYDLSFTDTSGKQTSLTNYSGRPMVLTFWASWCAPCKESMPEWNRLAKQLKDSIQFLTVAVADNDKNWKKAIRDYRVKGDLLSSSNFSELAPVYCKVWSVPTYIFVNNRGQIINYDAPHPNDPAFQLMLENLLSDGNTGREAANRSKK
jgi:thiol-disulfide isomerase/thioredoxin